MKPLALLVALVLGALLPRPALAQAVNNYIVGAQDVLAINVFEQQDLGGKFTVEADGSFTFPLIGRVKAGGHTLREIEEAMQARLAAGFFRNPHVSVAIEQYRSQQIFITGEVRTPGTYALTGGMTLIEALARAGSTTPDAGSEALIARLKPGVKTNGPVPLSIDAASVDDRVQVFRVDIKELQSGKLSQNMQLQDNDTVFISRASLVYVTGQVKSPGSFPLQKGMTVLQAVTLAGGIADRGASGRIVARRQRDGRVVEVRVKLDDPVLADDTIVVRERFF